MSKGALFKDENVKDKAPDYTGVLTLDEAEYRLAGWQEESKGGRPYISLVAQTKGDKEAPQHRGAFFKEGEKKQENSPDYTGLLEVEGQEYRLAGWFNTSAKGLKYLGLVASLKEPASESPAESQAPAPAPAADEMDW